MDPKKLPKLDASAVHRKLKLAGELFQFAMEIKITQLRRKHPEWTEKELTHHAYALIEKRANAGQEKK